MRISYTPNPPPTSSAEEEEILKRIVARRGSQGLIDLDLALLHAPLIADGYNSFLAAIRTRNSLPADIREIAFCRVAALTHASYEWNIHAPMAREAGIAEAALAALKGSSYTSYGYIGHGLSRKQGAVVEYVDAMTKKVEVPENIFERIKEYFDEKEIVELTVTIAAANAVNRFVVALDVGGETRDG